MRALGFPVKKIDVVRYFKEIPKDITESLNFEEFIRIVGPILPKRDSKGGRPRAEASEAGLRRGGSAAWACGVWACGVWACGVWACGVWAWAPRDRRGTGRGRA